LLLRFNYCIVRSVNTKRQTTEGIVKMDKKEKKVVIEVLARARELVAAGFVKDRDAHSAEAKKGKLVKYTDESAARFTPSAAIWRAEHEILANKGPVLGKALTIFTVKTPKHPAKYRAAKRLKDVLEWFDTAINAVEGHAGAQQATA